MSHPHARPAGSEAPAAAPLDLSEKGGPIDGKVQSLDRRLFMSLTVFTGCRSTDAAIKALAGGVDCVVYEEVGDPTGLGVLAMSENPADFVTKLRRDLQSGPFAEMRLKPEFSMLGRTYSLGYEPRLEDWLIHRPKRVVSDLATPWAVWYPLRRTGAFARLPKPEQGQILKEHGIIGRQFGDAGLASDIRLACHGLDKSDNDFVIGLIGKELAPLSQLVETMRPTVQTSQYLESLGPFFVGRAVWRSSKP
jgi:chlorite dismutase